MPFVQVVVCRVALNFEQLHRAFSHHVDISLARIFCFAGTQPDLSDSEFPREGQCRRWCKRLLWRMLAGSR